MKASPRDRHFVYRIWDSRGVLTWIGATSRLGARMADYDKHFDVARWTATEYPTRAAAFAAERAAIASEQPTHNRQSKKGDPGMTLQPDYSLEEVADALGMSTRWVRDRIRLDGVEHIRYGLKIRFTAEQVDKLRARHTQAPTAQPVTTGKKRRRS